MIKTHNARQSDEILCGAIAGAVGGIAATWLMDRYHSLWSAVSEQIQPQRFTGRARNETRHRAEQGEPRSKARESESATERAANRIGQLAIDRPLTRRERRAGGAVLHYLFGGLTGAAYGAAAEVTPVVSRGYGVPFGTAVWLVADEIAASAAGLAKPPQRHPLSTHMLALTAHFMYGAATEFLRRRVRQGLLTSGRQ